MDRGTAASSGGLERNHERRARGGWNCSPRPERRRSSIRSVVERVQKPERLLWHFFIAECVSQGRQGKLLSLGSKIVGDRSGGFCAFSGARPCSSESRRVESSRSRVGGWGHSWESGGGGGGSGVEPKRPRRQSAGDLWCSDRLGSIGDRFRGFHERLE